MQNLSYLGHKAKVFLMLYSRSPNSSALSWRSEGLRSDDGILIGSDEEFESWIPWWYFNYSKYNSFPIAIADFGMSKKMLDWCAQKWEIIKVDPPEGLFEKRIEPYLSQVESKFIPQKAKIWACWYLKPFILLQSPFQRTLWIDIDTLIRKSISELYEYAREPHQISMGIEEPEEKVNRLVPMGILRKGDKLFNSGVIVYLHKAEIVQQWAKATLEDEGFYLGDQQIFSKMVSKMDYEIPVLPKKYNWLVNNEGINQDAAILHFAGISKPMGQQLVKDFTRLMGNEFQ